ncbi:PAS domain-containing protein [Geomonas sp. Red32]|uniref:MASE3 domain-containing protein n=1 Tax=Geomonas sp. Red32 TaxID=2912856 RepID=UPI00202CF420|nr:MASE3 domain-containing protein [Geomonas sp. Red32]MCM0082920.1 PAS domain-containing protein [Geomonas sp. Red32]
MGRVGTGRFLAAAVAVAAGLFLSARYSYLLFHSLVEFASISLALTTAILVWNTRERLENGFLMVICTGFAAAGAIDLHHTLAYRGMNVFPGYDANLPTQLWVAARALQTTSFLAAPLLIGKKPRLPLLMGGYALLALALLWAVFHGDFPDCYREGTGLTRFKIVSEYAISLLLVFSLPLLWRIRSRLSRTTFRFIMASAICTILSEIAFTRYVAVSDFANMAGHYLKLAAYYLVYRAIFVCGVRRPFHTLFRELRQSQLSLVEANQSVERKVEERTAQLREQEELLSAVLQSARDGILRCDRAGRILAVNDAYCRMSGFSCTELLTMRVHDLSERSPEELERLSRQVVAAGQAELEGRHRRKDGTPFDVEVSARYLTEGGGVIVTFVRNVTTKKLVESYRVMSHRIMLALNTPALLEDILAETVSLVKSMTGVDAVAVRLKEGEDFPIIRSDGYSAEFLERERSLAGRSSVADLSGSLRLECTCGVVASGATGPGQGVFTPRGSAWSNDSFSELDLSPADDRRYCPRNECRRHGYVSMALVPIRAKGEIVGVLQMGAKRKGCFIREEISLLEDVAEHVGEALLRKQAEQALLDSEETLRAITDNAAAIIYMKDSAGRYLLANRLCRELMPPGTADPIGRSDFDMFPPEVASLLADNDRRVLHDGVPASFEEWLPSGGGRRLYISVKFPLKKISGEIYAVCGISTDITDRKRAEEERLALETQLQQARKMESVGRLAGGVAHDFNNMLGVILGYAELSLLQLESDHPVVGALQEIVQAAQRSAELTRQLLAFARRQPIAPKVVDLNETVNGMLKMLKRLIGEDVTLMWHPGEGVWAVKADCSQLDQIVANLCVNARDALGSGGTITIETANCTLDEAYCADHLDSRPGEYVRLSVADNGHGMDPETLSQVFEPFFTTKGVGKGTGLGLATVFGAVKQNGGFLEVESAPGEGAVFRIYLPRHPEPAVAKESAPSAAITGGSETVLVVEDEAGILQMATVLLNMLGYRVLAASSPEEALQVAAGYEGTIDLLMTDVIMPGMNGRALAEAVQACRPGVRILFMSGYAADFASPEGAVGEQFIQKPFNMGSLAKKLREALA